MPKRIKETRPEFSTLAAELLAKCPKKGWVSCSFSFGKGVVIRPLCKAKQFRSLMALALGMDQTKGQSPPSTKRRKRK